MNVVETLLEVRQKEVNLLFFLFSFMEIFPISKIVPGGGDVGKEKIECIRQSSMDRYAYTMNKRGKHTRQTTVIVPKITER
jgi:hypothetical protein